MVVQLLQVDLCSFGSTLTGLTNMVNSITKT